MNRGRTSDPQRQYLTKVSFRGRGQSFRERPIGGLAFSQAGQNATAEPRIRDVLGGDDANTSPCVRTPRRDRR